MKIPKRYRPQLCCSKDPERYNLSTPYYDAEVQRIVATDGHMMAVVPAEDVQPSDPSGYLPSEHDHSLSKFPTWRMALPSFKDGDRGVVSIALDAGYLAAIASAINAQRKQVVLTFLPDTTTQYGAMILVRPCNLADENDAFGVLMPCRLPGDLKPIGIKRQDLPVVKAARKKVKAP